MKLFFHFLKYNFIFNRAALLLLSGIAIVIVGISHLTSDDGISTGYAIMQYCSYIFFIKITGKLNHKTSHSFDTKHMAALPINFFELVLLKSLADTIDSLPIIVSFMYGFYLGFPEYNIVVGLIILVMVLTLGNIIGLNKRIDFSRMQYSKASVKNSILYLNKYLEGSLFAVAGALSIAMLIGLFKNQTFLLGYSFFVLLSLFISLATIFTIKMYSDETLSYFFWKRDGKRIFLKGFVAGLPILLFFILDLNPLDKKSELSSNKFISHIVNHLPKGFQNNDKDFLLAIANGDGKKLNEFLKEGKSIPWDKNVLGNFPPHLVILANNSEAFDLLVLEGTDWIEKKSVSTKKTPLHIAAKHCHLWAMKKLIDLGANINVRDTKGNTPVLLAAKNKCHGGLAFLKFKGADISVKDKNGKSILSYIQDDKGMKELVELSLDTEAKPFRGIASEKE